MVHLSPNVKGKRCRKCSFMCFGANSRRNFFGHMVERHSRGKMERIKICNTCYFNCNSNLNHVYRSHFTRENCDGADAPDFDLPADGPWILVSLSSKDFLSNMWLRKEKIYLMSLLTQKCNLANT